MIYNSFAFHCRYDDSQITLRGPQLAAADIITKIGGKVKFVNDEVWYYKFRGGRAPIPQTYEEGYHIEAIDVSRTIFMLCAFDYFSKYNYNLIINDINICYMVVYNMVFIIMYSKCCHTQK